MTSALPASPRLLDPHFRWRGHELTRIEALCDAVFAIVLGLLFLRAMPPETFADLAAAMKALVPFAVSFAIVSYIWVEHYLFSRRYDLTDGLTVLLQLVLLFLVLFYTYPLKYLFTSMSVMLLGPIGNLTTTRMREGMTSDADMAWLFFVYGLGYAAIFGTFALLYWRAWRQRVRLSLNEVECFLTRSAILQCLVQTTIALLSALLAMTHLGIRHGLPGWTYFLIGPSMAAHGIWQGRRLRLLGAG